MKDDNPHGDYLDVDKMKVVDESSDFVWEWPLYCPFQFYRNGGGGPALVLWDGGGSTPVPLLHLEPSKAQVDEAIEALRAIRISNPTKENKEILRENYHVIHSERELDNLRAKLRMDGIEGECVAGILHGYKLKKFSRDKEKLVLEGHVILWQNFNMEAGGTIIH
ncbi:MAG: hypothetical protein ABGX83_05360 [Nitrospira sp.]